VLNGLNNMNRTKSIFLLILSLGIFLRFYDLQGESLQGVEYQMPRIVSCYNFVEKVENFPKEKYPVYTSILKNIISWAYIHPPVYYYCCRLIKFAMDNDATYRIPSTLGGVFSIIFIYLLGTALFGSGAGLLASFLFTISPFNIYYSQYAHSYGLLTFFCLAAMYFFISWLKTNKKIYWFLMLIFNILSIYTHVLAYFIILAQIIYFLHFRKAYAGHKKLFIFASGLLFLAWLFWVPVLIDNFRSGQACEPQPETGLPLLAHLARFIVYFSWGYSWHNFGSPILKSALMSGLLLFMGILLFFFPLLYSLRSIKKNKKQIWFLLYYLALVFLCHLIFLKNMGRFRVEYMSYLLPAFICLVTKGLLDLPKKIRIIFISLITFFSILSLNNYYRPYIFVPFKQAARFIENKEGAKGIIFITNQESIPYYYKGKYLIYTLVDLDINQTISKHPGYDDIWFVFYINPGDPLPPLLIQEMRLNNDYSEMETTSFPERTINNTSLALYRFIKKNRVQPGGIK